MGRCPVSLFGGLLKYLKGRKIINKSEIKDQSGDGTIVLQLQGSDNKIENLTINNNVAKLATNHKILTAVENSLAPLKAENIDRVEFRDGHRILETTDEVAASDIRASCRTLTAESEQTEPQTITTWIKAYSPVYDSKAKLWRFKFKDHHIYADISETSIAADAISRGGAMVDDLYKVKMEIVESVSADNKVTTNYKIKEVLEFRPAARQGELSFKVPSPPEDDISEESS